MSKKAEELVLNIGQLIAPLPATYKGGEKIVEINVKALQGATALIDDFARKVLERAAERFRKKYFSLVATEEYEDDEIADMWNLYITEHCCAAILSPEED